MPKIRIRRPQPPVTSRPTSRPVRPPWAEDRFEPGRTGPALRWSPAPKEGGVYGPELPPALAFAQAAKADLQKIMSAPGFRALPDADKSRWLAEVLRKGVLQDAASIAEEQPGLLMRWPRTPLVPPSAIEARIRSLGAEPRTINVIAAGARAYGGGGEEAELHKVVHEVLRAFPNADVRVVLLEGPRDPKRLHIDNLGRYYPQFDDARSRGQANLARLRLQGVVRTGRLTFVNGDLRPGRLRPNHDASMTRAAHDLILGSDVSITTVSPGNVLPQMGAVPMEPVGRPKSRVNVYMLELGALVFPVTDLPLDGTPILRARDGVGAGAHRLAIHTFRAPHLVEDGVYGPRDLPSFRQRLANTPGNRGRRAALLRGVLPKGTPQAVLTEMAEARWGVLYSHQMDPWGHVLPYLAGLEGYATSSEGRSRPIKIFAPLTDRAWTRMSAHFFDGAGVPRFGLRDLRAERWQPGGDGAIFPNVEVLLIPPVKNPSFRGLLAGAEAPNFVTGAASFSEALSALNPFMYEAFDVNLAKPEGFVAMARRVFEDPATRSQLGVTEADIDLLARTFSGRDHAAARTDAQLRLTDLRGALAAHRAGPTADSIPDLRGGDLVSFGVDRLARAYRGATGHEPPSSVVDGWLVDWAAAVDVARYPGDPATAAHDADAARALHAQPELARRMFGAVSQALLDQRFMDGLAQDIRDYLRLQAVQEAFREAPAAERAVLVEAIAMAHPEFLPAIREIVHGGREPTIRELMEGDRIFTDPAFERALERIVPKSVRGQVLQALGITLPRLMAGVASLLMLEEIADALGIEPGLARLGIVLPSAMLSHKGLEALWSRVEARLAPTLAARVRATAGTSRLTAGAATAPAVRSATARAFGKGIGFLNGLAPGFAAQAVVSKILESYGVDPRSTAFKAASIGSFFLPDLIRAAAAPLLARSPVAGRLAGLGGRAVAVVGWAKLLDDAIGLTWGAVGDAKDFDVTVGLMARDLRAEGSSHGGFYAVANPTVKTILPHLTALSEQDELKEAALGDLRHTKRLAELRAEVESLTIVSELAQGGKLTVAEVVERLESFFASTEGASALGLVDFMRTDVERRGIAESPLTAAFDPQTGRVKDQAALLTWIRGVVGVHAERLGEAHGTSAELRRRITEALRTLPAEADATAIEATRQTLEPLFAQLLRQLGLDGLAEDLAKLEPGKGQGELDYAVGRAITELHHWYDTQEASLAGRFAKLLDESTGAARDAAARSIAEAMDRLGSQDDDVAIEWMKRGGADDAERYRMVSAWPPVLLDRVFRAVSTGVVDGEWALLVGTAMVSRGRLEPDQLAHVLRNLGRNPATTAAGVDRVARLDPEVADAVRPVLNPSSTSARSRPAKIATLVDGRFGSGDAGAKELVRILRIGGQDRSDIVAPFLGRAKAGADTVVTAMLELLSDDELDRLQVDALAAMYRAVGTGYRDEAEAKRVAAALARAASERSGDGPRIVALMNGIGDRDDDLAEDLMRGLSDEALGGLPEDLLKRMSEALTTGVSEDALAARVQVAMHERGYLSRGLAVEGLIAKHTGLTGLDETGLAKELVRLVDRDPVAHGALADKVLQGLGNNDDDVSLEIYRQAFWHQLDRMPATLRNRLQASLSSGSVWADERAAIAGLQKRYGAGSK